MTESDSTPMKRGCPAREVGPLEKVRDSHGGYTGDVVGAILDGHGPAARRGVPCQVVGLPQLAAEILAMFEAERPAALRAEVLAAGVAIGLMDREWETPEDYVAAVYLAMREAEGRDEHGQSIAGEAG